MMKTINLYKYIKTLICLCAFSLLISACGSKKRFQYAGVQYKNNDNQTITLTSVGFGKSKRDAVLNAEKNAFDVLLFKGVPGSPFSKPIIPSSETEVKKKNESFFDDFYDKQEYKSFVTNSSVISPAAKDKQTKKMKAAVELTINIASLRRNLEQKGVTHKFGL